MFVRLFVAASHRRKRRGTLARDTHTSLSLEREREKDREIDR